jgi:predicted DNA-binding antitoxin AbrB/MazE fold protein
MSKRLRVVYENGTLRPLEPVSFHEQEQMMVLVLDQENTSPEHPVENCYDAAVRSGVIGCVDDAPHDLSTNPKYMEGFGR